MIKITLALLALLVLAFTAVHTNAQTNTTTTTLTATPTSTVQTTTTTAATAAPETISIQWSASTIYPGNNYSATIMLSKGVPVGQTVTIKFWNSDPSFHIADLTLDDKSSTTQWVYYWCTAAPTGANGFFFDINLQGTASTFYRLDPAFAQIAYSPKKTVTVSLISHDMRMGRTYDIWVNISAPLSPNGYIMITPTFDSQYLSFSSSSVVIQGSMTTGVKVTITPVAITGTNGTWVTWAISGMESNTFNSEVLGGAGTTAVHVLPATTTTTTGAPTEPTTTTTRLTEGTTTTTTRAQEPTTTTTRAQEPTTTTTTRANQEPTTTTTVKQEGTTTTTTVKQEGTTTTTTRANQEGTTTTTRATTTTTTAAAPTEVSINPSKVPPGWLVIKRKELTPLTTLEKAEIKNKLAQFLNFPSSLISVGQVDSNGDVIVVLETSATVNQAAVNAAIAEGKTLNTTELTALGAASVDQGTLAPSTAAPADKDNLALIVGCAVGGAVLLFIILAIVKAKTSAGTGVASAGHGASHHQQPNDRPLTQMEREMAQHQHQHRGTLDNEL